MTMSISPTREERKYVLNINNKEVFITIVKDADDSEWEFDNVKYFFQDTYSYLEYQALAWAFEWMDNQLEILNK